MSPSRFDVWCPSPNPVRQPSERLDEDGRPRFLTRARVGVTGSLRRCRPAPTRAGHQRSARRHPSAGLERGCSRRACSVPRNQATGFTVELETHRRRDAEVAPPTPIVDPSLGGFRFSQPMVSAGFRWLRGGFGHRTGHTGEHHRSSPKPRNSSLSSPRQRGALATRPKYRLKPETTLRAFNRWTLAR
jgi:hypothetical protein